LAQVTQRLRAAREKQAKGGTSSYLMGLFRAKSKSKSSSAAPPPESPAIVESEREDTPAITKALEDARLKCASLFGANSRNAELCELKLWNQLLRQAGAPEILARTD